MWGAEDWTGPAWALSGGGFQFLGLLVMRIIIVEAKPNAELFIQSALPALAKNLRESIFLLSQRQMIGDYLFRRVETRGNSRFKLIEIPYCKRN